MTKLIRLVNKPLIIAFGLFVAALGYYVDAARNLPTLFNLDNHVNYAATRYLSEHRKIPVVRADDPQIVFSEFGTTRLLRPPFTFLVSAAVSSASKPWVEDSILRFRLGAPIIGALTVAIIFLGLCCGLGHNGLALTGATLIGLLPKFVLLASCNNDDIGALLSVSAMFGSTLALNRFGSKKIILVLLALSAGLVLQTKYTAWLSLPWLGLFCVFLLAGAWRRVVKMSPILLLVFISAGAWWPMLNMWNYGFSDPTALNHASEIQRTLTNAEPNRQGYLSHDIGITQILANHDNFLGKSYRSLIGYLEWVDLDVGGGAYWFYGLVFSIGLIWSLVYSVKRRTAEQPSSLPYGGLLLALLLSQCAFYVHHNLVRDIQPQARYLLPIVMPLVYLFLNSLRSIPDSYAQLNVGKRLITSHSLLSIAVICATVFFHHSSFADYIKPSFRQAPYFSVITRPSSLPLPEGLSIQSSQFIEHTIADQQLVLRRTNTKPAELNLGNEFCQQLPLNALISMRVSSPTRGGLHLSLDKHHAGKYTHKVWRSFPAGTSVALFSVNSEACSSAKITLSSRTVQVTLSDIQISELRIHQYGKPI